MTNSQTRDELEQLMPRFGVADRIQLDEWLAYDLPDIVHTCTLRGLVRSDEDVDAIACMLMFRLVELGHFAYLGDSQFVPSEHVN